MRSQLRRLKPGKAVGLENMPARLLVDSTDIVANPLTAIINISLQHCVCHRNISSVPYRASLLALCWLRFLIVFGDVFFFICVFCFCLVMCSFLFAFSFLFVFSLLGHRTFI